MSCESKEKNVATECVVGEVAWKQVPDFDLDEVSAANENSCRLGMPLTDCLEDENFKSRKLNVEDVWEGTPLEHSDDEGYNFLGFRLLEDVKRKEKKKSKTTKKKTLKIKSKSKKSKKKSSKKKKKSKKKKSKPSEPKVESHSKTENKEQDCSSDSILKRGLNGWEDSLRPRPAQVQYFQSLTRIRKRKGEKTMTPVQEKKQKTDEIQKNKERNIIDKSKEKNSKSKIDEIEKSEQNTRKQPTSPKKKNSSSKKDQITSKNSKARNKSNLEEVPNGLMVSKFEKSEQDSDLEPRMDASVGEIVWAKLGSTRWWPAIVIWGSHCGQQPAKLGQVWVFWFGDHKISEVPRDKILDFTTQFGDKNADGGTKTFKRGVVEAIRECAARASVDISNSDSSALLEWARNGFKTKIKKSGVFLPTPENPIPVNVQKYLNKIKSINLEYYQNYSTDNVEARTPRNDCLDNVDSALKKVKDGHLRLEDICISCDSDKIEVVAQHPLFEGGLCKQCKDDIIETMYAYGEDGTNAYCVICGNAGELLICDNNDCNRVYCTGCIEIMVSPEAFKEVLEISPWLCYLCTEYDPKRNGLIHPKEDWQQNVMQLFQPEKHVYIPNIEDYKEKKPIRVLSLFDGIGTGKYVLDQLGIEVEMYYASEVDADAINVTTVQHLTNVKQLGNIEEITDVEIAKLGSIDLVIGGSPCNDLSLVNPARKGLYDPVGTGKLFFDFFRVLKAVQLANKGRHVFWLYENVASMPQEYKVTISRFLQVPPTTIVANSSCEPSLIDSKYFSPQNRARYFWGNIPGMYSPLQPHLLKQQITLDSVLTPNCNRKAMVEKIRTVTTRSNSLKQGKKCILPVVMDGEGDVLWVTELELVFGFPKHYTDVGNIPLGRRQQLLGKAWSVPVIKHIFAPLRNFFKTTLPVPSSS